MILPDSNIWIFGIDERVSTHADARAWFDRMDDEIALVPSIVQLEVLHYVGREIQEGFSDVAGGLLQFPGEVEPLTSATTRKSVQMLQDHLDLGIESRDAALLVHAQDHDATLVTHDQDLLRAAMHSGLDAHDPVANG